MKRLTFVIALSLIISGISSAQFFNKFSLAGGPIIGWQIPGVDDLNCEMKKLGIAEFSKSGFLTTGGGGFIDVPTVNNLRLGVFAMGFTDNQKSNILSETGTIKTAKLHYNYLAVSAEYVKKLGESFEFTAGGNIGFGSLELTLSEISASNSNWNVNDPGLSGNYANRYSISTVSFTPQIGFGIYPMNFVNLKLNTGYSFTVRGDWKLNDALTVSNVPSGIKPDGFNFNLGINIGLFVK